MTMTEGSRRLAARHEEEQDLIRRGSELARTLFDERGEVGEGELVDLLLARMPKLGPDIAFAVVDDLRSQGLASKDWVTGKLSHTR